MLPIRGNKQGGGGKAATVNEQTMQLSLSFGTAENPKGAVDGAEGDPSRPATHAAPKPKSKIGTALSATMEEVCARLEAAFEYVASNKGAPGPDRQSIEQVRKSLSKLQPKLQQELLSGKYIPGAIRRVWIPKAGGGQRGLGIPNVVDRMVQQAVRMVLEPLYEPTFHESSHGFRPGRGRETAIMAAYEHVNAGHTWVVDIDLEAFFDRVNHQRLMARIEERVQDSRLRTLIHRMLQAKVVMPSGVLVAVEEGVPQGGPLSPLLSNIVLDELDQELTRRGHRFVRYADDCNIYVKSERAGKRVMQSISAFIEKKMRLKVNAKKSAVARPEDRHFVGFRLKREDEDGSVEVLLSKRTRERIDSKVRELTPRTWGNSLQRCIDRINVYLRGWISAYAVCTSGVIRTLETLEAHIRRRLRALILRHWKTKRTIARRLIQQGVSRKTVSKGVFGGRKGLWALSIDSALHQGLRNAYFAERGLVSLVTEWKRQAKYIGAPGEQLKLFLGIGEVANRPATG